MKTGFATLFFAVAVLMWLSEPALAESNIDWQVISAGGTDGSSSSFRLVGTVAQTAVAEGSSSGFGLSHGYWQEFGASYVCGDADGNGIVNVSDAVSLISYIFGGGPPPEPLAAGDLNCDGIVNVSDVVYAIAYIFGGGSAPCDPDGNGVPDC
jgi:hypothetical protein